MEEKDISSGFSIPAMLLVTGSCFLLFTLVLRILDGVTMKFFLDTGFLFFVAGVITGFSTLVSKRPPERSGS